MLIFADAIRGFTTRASSCGPRRSAKLSIDEKRFDFSEGISCISHPYSFFSEKRDKQYKRVTNTMSLDAFPRKSNFRSHSEKSSVFSSNCKLPTLNNNHTENKMCTLRPWSMAQEELTKYKSSLKNTWTFSFWKRITSYGVLWTLLEFFFIKLVLIYKLISLSQYSNLS